MFTKNVKFNWSRYRHVFVKLYDPKFEEKLDANIYLIGFNNGVYDLKESRFRPGTPDDCVKLSTGYDWEEYSIDHEYVKGIKKFVQQVQNEEDMSEYILTLLASYLDGSTKKEQFIIWTGTGGNGKSKLIEFFMSAFGEYTDTLPVTLLTQKRAAAGSATPELAEMRGKRFGVFQESEKKDELQVGYMKELTGGDMIITRRLYKDPIKYKPQFKLLLACNKLPTINSDDGGTWRRLRVSPFESEFVDKPNPKLKNQFKRDYELSEKLELWKKAFLWLLIKVYYPIYMKTNLIEPEKVTQFTKKYKKQSDVFLEYIDASIVQTRKKEDYETFTSVWVSFKFWYSESYVGRCPFSLKDLVDYFNANNFKCDKKNVYGIKYTGIDEKDCDLDAE